MNEDAKLINPDEVPSVTPAGWGTLRRFTDARIALGRAGHSLPTAPHLAFQLAHAQARDAVHLPLDVATLSPELQALGLDVLPLHSAALGLHVLVDGLIQNWLLDPQAFDLEAVGLATIDAYLAGLKASPVA